MNPSDDLTRCSIFFLMLLLFIITVGADDRFRNCSSRFNCGIVNNVSYPFWGYNRAEYCGQPDFQLACEADTPKLIVKSVTYEILEFSSDGQSLKVARYDYLKTLCSYQYTNTSFDSTMFKPVDGLQDMALLYDCIDTFNGMANQFLTSPGTECSNSSGGKQSVYFGTINGSYSVDLTGICKVVVVPIPNYYVGLGLAHEKEVQDAIDEGFGLTWSIVDSQECNNCVNSGGQCGYINHNFTCFLGMLISPMFMKIAKMDHSHHATVIYMFEKSFTSFSLGEMILTYPDCYGI